MKLCWWCCHQIKTTVYQLPISVDERTGVFNGIGQFCGFSCVKAYNNETNHTDNTYNSKMLIARLIQSSQPDPLLVIPCAPPRECLIAFGGHLTIDEFRKSREDLRIRLAPIKHVSYDMDRLRTVKSSSVGSKPDVSSLRADCSSAKVINNPLKIKKKVSESKMPTDSVLCMLHNMHESVQ